MHINIYNWEPINGIRLITDKSELSYIVQAKPLV